MKYWSSKLILLHKDRQTLRQYPQKIQTASSISSAFSEGLNLANISKMHLSMPVYKHTMSFTQESHPMALCTHSQSAFPLSLVCLTGFVAHSNGLKRQI